NRLSAIAMIFGIILVIVRYEYLLKWVLYASLVVGTIIGLIFAKKIKMIEMPQMVALLNGVGGAASGIVAIFAFLEIGADKSVFTTTTSLVAILVGFVTLFGSLVAAGKLHKVLPQKPVVLKNHQLISIILLVLMGAMIPLGVICSDFAIFFLIGAIVFSTLFGIAFTIRVGGADMPITISLLNSLSGVAGAIAGLAIGDVLLVAVGGIVGASGLLLTQIMCRAMNRQLIDILLGKTTVSSTSASQVNVPVTESIEPHNIIDPIEVLKNAKRVIIVPGYGMAIAQAQHLVKQLADKLIGQGAVVKYAVHPVAGRMPGHMNVLLCEANVEYEDLYELDDINPEFKDSDVTIVVGANDVINPAARMAEGTPIYGMPILNVDECSHIIIFNFDLKPGYAGVPNPIYTRTHGVSLQLGDAAKTIANILSKL
ncbi:MAG: NAD(P)(+) transhydrogenase (Re/Si-specific) subunit beta, partial [Bacilli bacterium]